MYSPCLCPRAVTAVIISVLLECCVQIYLIAVTMPVHHQLNDLPHMDAIELHALELNMIVFT